VEKVYTANSLKVLIIELSVEPIHLKFSVHMFLWIFYSLKFVRSLFTQSNVSFRRKHFSKLSNLQYIALILL
jgi:hypothetical protein